MSSSRGLLFSSVEPALSGETLQAMSALGFTQLTPVQAATIPLFLTNKDVCVEATTGSGKTLAFGIPIFEILLRKSRTPPPHEIGALVVAPTRELASQIYEVLKSLSTHHTAYRCGLFVGGTSVADCVGDFMESGAQIIIGTPGRILDMRQRCETFSANLRHLEVLVLDEADTLLDMGFRDIIKQILSFLPKQRRTGLFSATQTKEVKDLARAGLRNPITVAVRVQQSLALAKSLMTAAGKGAPEDAESKSVEKEEELARGGGGGAVVPQATPSTLENWYTVCEYDERPQVLVDFLLQHLGEKVIVFCATCACVDYYSNVFHQMSRVSRQQASALLPPSLVVLGMHGKMVPKKRSGVFRKFVALESGGVMFCTDVAARGIDIPDVEWIVQLAAPKDPSFFVHRVGRTARAGRRGGALLFVSEEELPYIELLRGRGVPLAELPSNADTTGTSDKKAVLTEMKRLAKLDRELLEMGSTAFMAFLRTYKEHLCSYIFRISQLDIGSVARSYALLRLPKIPETRGALGAKIKFESTAFNTSSIPYRHKEKEEARQRRLKALHEADAAVAVSKGGGLRKGGRGVGGDDEGGKGEEEESEDDNSSVRTTQTIQSGRVKKAWVAPEEYVAPDEGKRKRKKKTSAQQKFKSEWDELAAEDMAYRKMKKGKMSVAEYEEKLFSEGVPGGKSKRGREGDDDDDDEDEEDEADDDDDEGGGVVKKDYRKRSKGYAGKRRL